MKKVAIITGASSGMGKATAQELQAKGIVVYGGARRLDRMNDLKESGVNVLHLDVTEQESVEGFVNTVLKREGQIDILINNAGYGSYGAVEDVHIDEAKQQFEVNLFGLARITQLVLPIMRAQKSGRIVNTSSVGGKVYTPFGAWYHATKHALEGWSDCLRLEVKEFGIDVVSVLPGAIKTDWGIIAAEKLRASSNKGAYAKFAGAVANGMQETYAGDELTSVTVLGKEIAKAATIIKPKCRYVKGYMGSLALFARKWLGDGIFEYLIMREFRKRMKP